MGSKSPTVKANLITYGPGGFHNSIETTESRVVVLSVLCATKLFIAVSEG
jgi:hypothetical protein